MGKLDEKTITSKDIIELYRIIGDSEFLKILVRDTQEIAVLTSRWKNRKTFSQIAEEMGLTVPQVDFLYKRTIRKVKSKVKRFVHFYVDTNKSKLRQKESIPTEISKSKDIEDLVIKDLIGTRARWAFSLFENGIITIGDLKSYSKKDLLMLHNIKKHTLSEIECLLNHYGYKLL